MHLCVFAAVTLGGWPVLSTALTCAPCCLLQVGTGAAVQIQATGWEDVVVWNPHLTMKACYDSFVCVENAQFSKPIELQPGKDWCATANFDVVDVAK